MAVLALGSPAKAAGSAQGSVRRVENKVRRQSEPPGSGCGAPRPGLAVWGCPLLHSHVPSAHAGWLRAGSTGSRLATAAAPACHPPLGPFPAPWLNPTTAAFLPGGEESLTHALAEINKRAEEPGSSSEPAAESPGSGCLAHCSSAESVLLRRGTTAASKTCGL